jgi:hypothetical protein
MSMGNQDARVDKPISLVTGPLVGSELLESFKQELITENVFQIMFGIKGERIFHEEIPNLNETILPAMLLSWKSETFNSNNTYFQGFINGWIVLPVKLEGNYNSLRRVASMVQRFMGGAMKIFARVPGLTEFGYGTEFNYDGLARFDGLAAPVIQMNIPFKFDLQLLRLDVAGFDPSAPLDASDEGFVTANIIDFINAENSTLLDEVISETGQTNP